MPGVGVVSLSRAHYILAAVRVGELEPTLEEVAPVLALAGVVGKALEHLWAAHSRGYVLEVGVVVAELGHSPFVVAQLLCGQLFLRYVHLSPSCRPGAAGSGPSGPELLAAPPP